VKPTGPEMNIGNAGRRPKLKPWVVLLKWTECPDGSYVSHDYRWHIIPDFGDWWLVCLSPSRNEWNGAPESDIRECYATAKAAMIHSQDYSDGFRKHVWESIHGPYQETRRAR
jgi:hypothetical protein